MSSIIAVHGVNEKWLETWIDGLSETLWLRDLIPATIKCARILVYGHSANVSSFYGSGSAHSIQQYAQTMVKDIQEYRAVEDCSQRPIIFMCHGLGGILTKKALCYASTKLNADRHLYSVVASTYAILFFGTPHDDCEERKWSTSVVPDSSTGLFQRPKQETLDGEVDNNCMTLKMINDDFAGLMKQFQIFFYYEKLRSNIAGEQDFVVEASSAAPAIKGTNAAGIHATHSYMVKLTMDHEDYETIVKTLAQCCKEAPPLIAGRWRELHSTCKLQSAGSPHRYERTIFNIADDEQQTKIPSSQNRHWSVPQPVSSIFTGRAEIFGSLYKSLFSSDAKACRQQKRFIIYGVGGSGKTQFTCKFAQDFRDR